MPAAYSAEETHACVAAIKTLAIDAVEKAKSGHPGTPMGLADIAFALWGTHLRFDPQDPHWIGRDRFVLSCGHASMLQYALLHLFSCGLSIDDLKNFRQWESKTPGHPECDVTAGVEMTTGPLGQGVSTAVGMALGSKMKQARFGKPYEGARTWVIASDGDMMEGISGEAASLAGHWGLGNLVVIYDDNRITIEGGTDLAFSEDVGARYAAYGWRVLRIDGHDTAAIHAALKEAGQDDGRPTLIVARTHIAHGAPKAQDTSEAHGAPLGADEIEAVKTGLKLDPKQSFFVSDTARAACARRVAELGAERAAWQQSFDLWAGANAASRAAMNDFEARTVPADLFAQLLKAVPEKEMATRDLSGAIEQVVAKLVPSLVGGSADLGPSTKTLLKNEGAIHKGDFAGRNLYFGIREHAMGAICNGLALSGGFVPFGATFLVFADYMKPAIRLGAVMHQASILVFTHDSFMLGEDGPTHQPIEHLWSLRMIPKVAVIRPADGMECAAAWTMALERKTAPTVFSLSRQKLKTLPRPAGFDASLMLRGGYVVQDGGTKPDVVIMATGSEVGTALDAAKLLSEGGVAARVVSLPCIERFAEQDAAYIEQVLPTGVRRVSLEAGSTAPWAKWVGDTGLALGIDHFGASAPDMVLAEKFGFTGAQVAARIKSHLGR